jgi:hypothetical protein
MLMALRTTLLVARIKIAEAERTSRCGFVLLRAA